MVVVTKKSYGESLRLFVWKQLTLNHHSYEIKITAIFAARL